MREMMFKPFTTTKRKGNGLGLAICKKIVEEHGGTIAVEPGRSCGARFRLRLPAGN
jgi:signal transduction histidine kinase